MHGAKLVATKTKVIKQAQTIKHVK